MQTRHGDRAGYQQHIKNGTPPCTPCLIGSAADARKRQQQGKCARGLGWPLLPGKGQQ